MPLPADKIQLALLIRRFEETLLSLFAQGELNGTVHTCIGQEWSGVAAAAGAKPDEAFFSNHRGHGHYLAKTGDVDGLLAEVMGKESGVCAGLGGSQHVCSVEHSFFSNGIQGGMMPVATGHAWSQKLKKNGLASFVFIGDGTLGQGLVYESLNIASKKEIPLIVVVENNRYAQSTSSGETQAGSIEARAKAFDVAFYRGNTSEPDDLFRVFAEASTYTRTTSRPCVIEVETYRLKAHSKGDDNRDPAEILSHEKIDYLCQRLAVGDAQILELKSKVDARMDVALAKARAHKPLAAENLPSPSYAKSPADLNWSTAPEVPKERVVALINKALIEAFANRDNLIMFGEDIKSPYGGAFKVSKDLSHLYPNRVFNMPISESSFVGNAAGLSLGGFIPLVEVMFGDFLSLTFDQFLNHACKFSLMYNNAVKLPLIVRTPMGGRRGYGPTHSQSIEKHFLGLPNLTVLALNCRVSPELVYKTLFETIDGPTLVIENKVLYTRFLKGTPPAGYVATLSNEVYPTVKISPVHHKPLVTVFCYGGLLEEVEKALEPLFTDDEIFCEVICPTRLSPVDMRPLVDSVKKTGRLLIVEEGLSFAGLGSEVACRLSEQGVNVTQLKRLGLDSFIPSEFGLESQVLADHTEILNAVREITRV